MFKPGPGIGIFVDGRNPAPWARPRDRHYGQLLDLVCEAERLGAASVWLTEHHRFEDGYLPQPLVLAAAIAARTDRLRVATAVVLAPVRHPAHLAEEAAAVDLISGGRFELGLGAGYVAGDFSLFGADMGTRFAATDAAFLEVRRLLDEGVVTPRPVQRPFPLWLGYQSLRGARRAGRLGARLLSLEPQLVTGYLEGLVEGGHDPAAACVAGAVHVIVADDPEAAWAVVAPHYLYQANSYQACFGGRALAPSELGDRLGNGRVPVAVNLKVLTPDEATDELGGKTAGLPAAHVYTWATIAGMPDDLVQRHLELLFGPVRSALSVPATG